MFFGYGRGANGKGVFLQTVSHILGDYCKIAAIETFLRPTMIGIRPNLCACTTRASLQQPKPKAAETGRRAA